MAIETQCPHCKKGYRLKDELAGKRVTCANTACRKSFTVAAKPSANGPAPKPAHHDPEAEAAAAAVLADEPVQTKPEDERTLTMTCASCDHKWDVPWSMQGKNVLCPECRVRQKVPQQKTGKVDWRDSRAGRPSMARVEELEGVVGTVDVRHVSGETLKRYVIKEDIEARPRWHYFAWAATALALVGVVTYGVLLMRRSGQEDRRDQFLADAVADVQETQSPLPPAEAPLFKAGVLIAAGEFALRKDDPESLKAAIGHFNGALHTLASAPPSPGRDLLLGDLAVAQLALGGSAEQVANGVRIRWTPGGGRQAMNEKTYTVQQVLQETLKAMVSSQADVRFHNLRRLARELARLGQSPVLSDSLIGQVMPQDHAEAAAQVALESFRATRDESKVKADAAALAPRLMAAAANNQPVPPSAAVLFLLAGVPAPDKVTFPTAPSGAGDVSDEVRHTYALLAQLQGKGAEAVDLAKRPGGTSTGRLSDLAQIAEWSDDPAAAVDAARQVLPTGDARRRESIPDLVLTRLLAEAGRAGQQDAADAFAASISGDAYRAWGRAEALRHQLAAAGDQPADVARAEAPEDPKALRVGHARGRLALARHNARATGNEPDAAPTYDGWGAGTLKPFGLAGLALGLQDRLQR